MTSLSLLRRRRTQPLRSILTSSIQYIQQQSRVSSTCHHPFSTQSPKFPEYQMPSVTWGFVQGRKEKLVSRVIISDYLKSIGIVPDELEHLELPSTVDVMRERVEFLQNLGLKIDDMNEYPSILGCSVRKNMIPVLGYLEKIGIQRPRLGEFVKSYPQVLHMSVVIELVPVVKFLRGLDVERQDIGYVVMKYPELLGFKLEGTMSTSVAYLVSIGVNPRDIGPMVTQYPYFLGMRVGTMIKPLVDYLISLGLPKKILARMFEKRAYVLGYDLEETVKSNVDCLISFGIRREALASVIAQYPLILGLPLKAKLSTQQYIFNLKLNIDPDGFARVVERMPQIVSLNQSVIMKSVEFLLGRGILAEDVAKMVVKCPQLIAVQVGLMKNSFYFLKSEMGRPVKELVEFPEYFTYSLESRIKPRYQRLESRGIRCSLAWFLNCSDQRFEERLQADYIETECAGPSFCMGGKLELPGSEVVSDEENESDDEILYRCSVVFLNEKLESEKCCFSFLSLPSLDQQLSNNSHFQLSHFRLRSSVSTTIHVRHQLSSLSGNRALSASTSLLIDLIDYADLPSLRHLQLTHQRPIADQNLHLETIHIPGIINESEYSVLLFESFLEGSNGEPAQNSSLILAPDGMRTKDPLDDLTYYIGGWNISDKSIILLFP